MNFQGLADTDDILALWSSTMCSTLVHKLGYDKPNTTKELLDIATRHASGEEAVGDAFVLGDGEMAPAVAEQHHPKLSAKALRVTRRGRSSTPDGSQSLPAAMMMTRKRMTPKRSMSQPPRVLPMKTSRGMLIKEF
jgi:hypothetical protein